MVNIHSSGDFTKANRSITPVAKEFIETIIQEYDSKLFRIHMLILILLVLKLLLSLKLNYKL
jgi:hypothetical protein